VIEIVFLLTVGILAAGYVVLDHSSHKANLRLHELHCQQFRDIERRLEAACPRAAVLKALKSLERRIMSAIGDQIREFSTAVDETIARCQADIDDLKLKVEDGTATPEELKLFAEGLKKLKDFDPIPDAEDVLPDEDEEEGDL
jgi:hypothetical protein